MRKIMFYLLLALPATALAAGWTYLVYDNGELIYEGPNPPVDLSYPSPGQPAPTTEVDSSPQGTLLTPAEAARVLTEPHVIVIPPGVERRSSLAPPPGEEPAASY